MKSTLVISLLMLLSMHGYSQDQVINGNLSIGNDWGEILGQGKKLNFGGVQGNTDLLSISRFNRAYNDSDLRVSIGDDLGSPGDRFVVGTTKWENGLYYPHFMVRADGRVGINTEIVGDEILGVNGKIRAVEIKVEAKNWPDYVFEQKYTLTPLPELEKYIQEHKHLPEIPSTSEVQNNGVDLGEMNTKLLKKIEELTLHLIEIQKDNQEIKKRISKFENGAANNVNR